METESRGKFYASVIDRCRTSTRDSIPLLFLPLGCDYPVVPTELRKVYVEPLLAALTLNCAAAFDRSSPNSFHSRRIRANYQERPVRILSTCKEEGEEAGEEEESGD